MADRFRDIQILIGAQADMEAYDEVSKSLREMDVLADQISANLNEANNRELRNISRRVKAFKQVKAAYDAEKATVGQLREAHDKLADSMDALNEKADKVRGGRAEEDLRAMERQAAAEKERSRKRLEDNLQVSLADQDEHTRKLDRIKVEGERQRHQINATAERQRLSAIGEKNILADIETRRSKELADLKERVTQQKEVTAALRRQSELQAKEQVGRLSEQSKTAGEKAALKVQRQREKELRNARKVEEDIGDMRIRNERTIASIRHRASEKQRRESDFGFNKDTFSRVRSVASGAIGVHVLGELVGFLKNTALELSNVHQQVESLKRSFVSLNKGALEESNVLLSRLDRALLFSAKRVDQLRIGNLALNSGVEALDARLPDMIGNIRKVSLALGRDVVEDVERVIKAIAKMETELLDELGIATRATAAHEAYARSLGRTAQSLTAVERLEAFAIATGKELQDKADRLTSVIHLQRQAVGRLAAEWEQVRLALGSSFSGILLSHIETIRSLITELRLMLSEGSEIAQTAGFGKAAAILEAQEQKRKANEFIQRLGDAPAIARPGGEEEGRGSRGNRRSQGLGLVRQARRDKLLAPSLELYDELKGTIDQIKLQFASPEKVTKEWVDQASEAAGEIIKEFHKANPDLTDEKGLFHVSRLTDDVGAAFKKLLELAAALQSAANLEKKDDSEKRLRALETEFTNRRAELDQSSSAALRDIQHQVLTGELGDNLPQRVQEFTGFDAELKSLKELVLEFKGLDDAQIIRRRNELNAVSGRLATTGGILVRSLLDIDNAFPDADTVDGYKAIQDAIKGTSGVMSVLVEQAMKLDIPVKQLEKAVESLGNTSRTAFADARQAEIDLVRSERPNNQIAQLQRRAQAVGGVEGTKLLLQAIQELRQAQEREIAVIEEAAGKAADIGDAALVSRLLEQAQGGEAIAEREGEVSALLAAVNRLWEQIGQQSKRVDDEKDTEVVTREIRRGSKELLSSSTKLLGTLFSIENQYVALITAISRTELVRGAVSNIQTGKSLLEGASLLSAGALGLTAAASLLQSWQGRQEERERARELKEQKALEQNAAQKNRLKSAFSGFEPFDDVLQSSLQAYIEDFEYILKDADTPERLIAIVNEFLDSFKEGATLGQGVEGLRQREIVERRNPRTRTPGVRDSLHIAEALASAQSDLIKYFPDNTELRDLALEVIRLSDAFQTLTDSTAGVTEAQKQEVKDRFAVEREALLANASRTLSSDPYEQAQQVANLRAQLSAIRDSERAALGSLSGSSGFTLPDDFDSILTQFGDALENAGAGKISPYVEDEVTVEQIATAQKWLDELFALLNVDSPELRAKIVAYLASIPGELSANLDARAILEIADILGLNEHTLYTTGLFTQLLDFFKTVPQELQAYLGSLTTIPFASIINVADVDQALQTLIGQQLLEVTTLGAAMFIDGEDIPIMLDQVTSVTPGEMQVNTTNLLDATLLASYMDYKDFRGEQKYGILLDNLTRITTGSIEERAAIQVDSAVSAGFDDHRKLRTNYKYVINLDSMVDIRTGSIGARVRSAIDSAVSSAIRSERASIAQQYARESSAPSGPYTTDNGF